MWCKTGLFYSVVLAVLITKGTSDPFWLDSLPIVINKIANEHWQIQLAQTI